MAATTENARSPRVSLVAAWAAVRSAITRAPVTSGIVVAVLAIGAATQSLWSSATEAGLTESWGWGLDAFEQGRWWTIVGGLAIAPEPWMYLLILTTFIVGAGYLESRYGAWRMLAASLGTHIVAVLLTAGILWALQDDGPPWAQALAPLHDVGLSNAGFGAVGAVTAGLSLHWRRRARLIGSLYCLIMVLYAGEIWDLTHAAAFAAGLAIGPWVVGRPYERPVWHFGSQEARDTAAVLIAFDALHDLLNAAWPGEGGLLEFGTSLAGEPASLGVIGSAVLTLTFAYALHRGSRIAWWYNVVVSALAIPLLILLVIYAEEAHASVWFSLVLQVVALAVLIGWRRHFRVAADRGQRRNIYRRILLAAAGIFVFGTVAILALRDQFTPEATAGTAIGTTLLRLIGQSGGIEPSTAAARTLVTGLSVAWFLAVVIAVAALLLTSRRSRAGEEQAEVFAKLQTSTDGMSSIGYMARWPGIQHWVSDDGLAAFGFRLEGNTAIVLSNPAGTPGDVRRSYKAFHEHCRDRGWRPVYFAVDDRVRADLEDVGWASIQVAEDTQIPLPELEFKGKSWQSVRSALNKATKAGVTMRSIRMHDAPHALVDQLEAISAQWAGDKALPEMGFTLGDLPEARDPNVLVHVAVDEDGTVHGMTSWLPVYRNGEVIGWTVDIMKRRLADDAMPGVMEFLIASSAMVFKQDGYEMISLSSAPLSYSEETDGPIERMLDLAADRMEPYYGFASLERFKAKFKPQHVPLYLCYPDDAQLPAIAIALVRAYLPGVTAADLVRAGVTKG